MLTRFARHNSLGRYYRMLTQYLGYQMTNDEYKVMGLLSYGSPNISTSLPSCCARPASSTNSNPSSTSACATRRYSPAISRRGRSASSPRKWRRFWSRDA
ncbi:carbamoyltransferase N-terminal domain-containing protein [Bradyrhizobium sp. LB12.1]|uniref:carbamoyltransferase N-terminal domain-containing protein n=1 Tax=Bradyrhizobium sp. LB12.1 TaxID=3156327 RepID=UPI003393BF6D